MSLPPLILIHGYPFDHTMWKYVVAELEGKTRVITPDLPGFGDNPAENAEPSIDLMADDIVELFALHRFSNAVVAGMSMGGYVALSFAARHAERLSGLGLISTQAVADTAENQQARRTMIQKVQHEGISRAVEAILPKMFSESNTYNPELKRFPRQGAENAGVEGICWALEAMARRPDRTAVLAGLQIPVSVIHGNEDKIVPAERARKMSEAIPNCEYTEVPAGHATPLEAPKAVAAALLKLLERSQDARPARPSRFASEEPGIIIAPTERGL